METIPDLLSKTCPILTRYLARQGVISVRVELISTWVPSEDGAGRRIVDNDMAYRGWYKAVVNGYIRGHRPLLRLEFNANADEDVGNFEDPRSKKRKQEVMGKDSDTSIEFRLGVWGAAKQTKY